jgi:hypothetical protein
MPSSVELSVVEGFENEGSNSLEGRNVGLGKKVPASCG